MAQTTGAWTLSELHRLPDDGNKYEVVFGELFVTPAPSAAHESLASVLRSILEPFVRAHALGRIYGPRSVVRVSGSEAEPDLMVRPGTRLPARWEDAPVPLLVVEIVSDSTRRRDHVQKRAYYLRSGVPQYWIVDGEKRTVVVVAPDTPDVMADSELRWQPSGANDALVIDVAGYFHEALGPAQE